MNTPPAPQDPRRELQTLLASRLPLIVVESREESRVLTLVREASLRVRQGRGWGVFQWTVTEGLQRVDVDMRCESFSGAEIEQAIVAALYSAHAAKQPVTATLIAHEMQATRPLAMVMAEKVAALRAWAGGRTVSAD